MHGTVYHITLVEMSDDFKSRLVVEYKKNLQWNKILDVVQKSAQEVAQETIAAESEETFDDDFHARRVGLRFKL